MGSPYADLDRPPLRSGMLSAALTGEGSLWRDLAVVAETPSTQADVAVAARAGAGEGLVIAAESQTAGRGRLGRNWSAPPRSGLTFSVLLRPAVPASRWGWLPLLSGVALAEAVRERAELDVRLKWPNDLLAPNGRKLAGVLAEVVGDAVVVGVGLNVTTRQAELDELPDATSLAIEGAASTDRDPLLRSILRGLADHYTAWVAAGGAQPPSYATLCETIGRRVRISLPGGGTVVGTASGVDDAGRLLVDADDGGRRPFAAGAVEHLRRPDAPLGGAQLGDAPLGRASPSL